MGKDTRSKYKVFLINDVIEILPSSQLPTGEQVLQYLYGKLFKARKENLKYRLCDMVSCKFPHGSFEIGCNNPGGCNATNFMKKRSSKHNILLLDKETTFYSYSKILLVLVLKL